MADPVGVNVAPSNAMLDTTPTWTRLDSIDNLVARYEISRGRTDITEETGTGTATIELNDTAGVADPAYGGSLDLDGRPAALALHNPVTDAWKTIFRGSIDDRQATMERSQVVTFASLELVDLLDYLAGLELGADVAVYPETTMGTNSDRINDALDDALVPNTAEFRNIFTGNVRMQASSYSSGQSILEVIDDAAEAEFPGIANRFVSKTGVFTFHGRLARFSPGDYGLHGIHTWKLGDGAAIADDSSTVQIRGLGWNRPRKAIINSAICTPKGIKPSYRAAQIVQDAASIAAYGIHSWSAEDLYVLHGVLTGNNALDECLLFANYYIATRKEPLTQVNQITVRSLDPSDPRAAQVWNFLCNAEIGDVITLTTTNPGGGGFADDFFIEGLHYTVEPLQPGYQNVTLELNVSPRGWFDFAWT